MKFLKHNLTSVILVSVLVISILMLLFAASLSFRQIQTLKKSQKSVVQSYQIYVELQQLGSYAADAEMGQRGFILTRDSIFLQPYFEALEKVKWSFARLNSLTADNFGQKRSLDSLVYLVNQRLSFLDHVLNDDAIEVGTSDTLKKLMLRGRDMMVLSLAQIDKMIFSELQRLKQRETEHENDVKFSPFSILFVVVFSLFVFISAFYKINKDLKGLAKTNNQLMINNQIFEHTEQIADISHWYWNIKENKLIYSVNLYRLLGCKPNEFEPTFENLLHYVHPADRHLLEEGKEKALKEMTPSMAFFRIIRKDGEVRHFKSIGKLITDNYGTSFSIGINADITDQYKKDKIIGEKLADLEKSNKQLSAFSHIASHDLQEPLRKIQIFISRFKENDLKQIPENIKDYLSGIKKETVRMQKFITDLLLYSRASKADKTFEVADLNEILENSKRELSHRIEEKNAIINSGDLPVLKVIPFQMQQLFSNLISNSIKYSKPDINPIIDVTSETKCGKEFTDSQNDAETKYYKITFSDNGIGFDPQYSEKIFTLFYRLHSNREYTGTGIGLAICRIIVENHKGYIFASGVPNVGATFSVYIPIK
jgi:PAS domain S-box-containing protein